MTTQRGRNVIHVWTTLGGRCINVAGLLGFRTLTLRFVDTCKQYRPISDAIGRGVWPGPFACRNVCRVQIKWKRLPETLNTGNGLIQIIRMDKSTNQKRVILFFIDFVRLSDLFRLRHQDHSTNGTKKAVYLYLSFTLAKNARCLFQAKIVNTFTRMIPRCTIATFLHFFL